MNYNELTELMKKAGWYLERHGKGSHKVWRHPHRQNPIVVPNHGSKELKPGLAKAILKQAGID